MYQAIAYVISAMPMERAAESLKKFALDILSQIHAAASKTTSMTTKELKEIGCKYFGMLPFILLNDARKAAWKIWKLCYTLSVHLAIIYLRPVKAVVEKLGRSSMPLLTSMHTTMIRQSVSLVFSDLDWRSSARPHSPLHHLSCRG